jgi:hypothetical protein
VLTSEADRLGDVLHPAAMGGDRATFSSRPTSHLPGALLTFEELAGIKCSIAAANALPPAPGTKGSGVVKRGKFNWTSGANIWGSSRPSQLPRPSVQGTLR